MIRANFSTYGSYVTDSLYQWDKNRDLAIGGLNLLVAPEIQFINATMKTPIVKQSTLTNGVVTVRIPNSLLQVSYTIKVYVGVYEGKTFKIIETIEIPIIAKEKPSDYTLEDSDEEVYSFNRLENMVANIVAHNNDTNGNTELIDLRVDYEGKIHPSAGVALRYQIDKIAELAEKGGISEERLEQLVREYLSQTPITAVPAKITNVTLSASDWVGDTSPFSQIVNIDGVTEYSQVDLTPSVEQLSIFYNKDLAFVTENDNGIVTVYAIGQKPTNDYIIQATVTEVNI